MGKFLEYAILLSNIWLVLALQEPKDLLHSNVGEKPDNQTYIIKRTLPKEQDELFNKRVLPLEYNGRRRPTSQKPKQMRVSPGLNAFSAENFDRRVRRRNYTNTNTNYSTLRRINVVPTFSQPLYPRKNLNPWSVNFHSDVPSQKLSKIYNPNNSKNQQSKASNDLNRRFHNERNSRGYHPRHPPKICDPCNSVPWVPLLKVPDSYRKQRTHVTELHPTPHQDFNFDYHGFSSNSHNVLLPSVPLVPTLGPVYDGTISSSFGLPVGNIPTSHGLLAPVPIATKISAYTTNTIDYGNSFNFFSPPSLLDNHPFPELSPVPIVPIHDSGQFYQADTSVPDLVPPPVKNIDVSKVVLTIEENSPTLEPPKPTYHNHKPGSDISLETTAVDSQHSHSHISGNNNNIDFGKLEIVQSVPVAEFTSAVNVHHQNQPFNIPPLQNPTYIHHQQFNQQPINTHHQQFTNYNNQQSFSNHNHQQSFNDHNQNPIKAYNWHSKNLQQKQSFSNHNQQSAISHQQELPLYPPLQSDFSDSKISQEQKSVTSSSNTNFDFLVPPVQNHANFNSNITLGSSSHSSPSAKSEIQSESSAPKPLTSPSLSWLFSDHTAPPQDSESTSSVTSFASESREIASVVNKELSPVSPHPLPETTPNDQNVGNSKSKKIQIIIPYTTKNKNGHDNNAIESIQHEVFQPPVGKSTSENNSLRDFATSPLPPLTHSSETNRNTKVIDGLNNSSERENQHVGDENTKKYLSEMHHIIASNIRELLKEEIQKSQKDQNYPLQNNIDNWTALEYSNHKTVEGKAPKEVITQALAVTSIPGTSISHLLLPSKKIPNEYFATTPLPIYDEPNTSVYRAVNSTVNSSPFTAKPYATTNIYNATKSYRKNDQQTTIFANQFNHERNYTEVAKERVNNWGRLNENLVLPEARSKTRRIEQTTATYWNHNYYSPTKEKIQIVTPVSLTNARNYTTTTVFRRTTRHIQKIESPTTESLKLKPQLLKKLNSTKLEKVVNQTSPFYRHFSNNSTIVNSTKTFTKLNKTNITMIVNVKTTVNEKPRNETSEEVKLASISEHLSINDIIPFRNKELPWQTNSDNSSHIYKIPRQRKSLIKQSNLPKVKKVSS